MITRLRITRLVFLLMSLLALLPSCASLPTAHLGPVTALAADGMFSCSQAGVQTPTSWILPDFRAVTLDVRPNLVLIGGGVPGERGDLALYTFEGELVARTQLTEDLVYSVALHPTKPTAVVGCADGSVHVLSIPDLQVVGQLTAHTAPCRAVRISDDGRLIATGGLDGLVYLYAKPGPPKWVLKEHTAGIECLVFRGTELYSGARDGKVRLHRGGMFVRTYQRLGGRVHGLCARDGKVFAGIANGRVFELEAGKASSVEVGRTEDLYSLGTRGRVLVAGVGAGVRAVSEPGR